MNWAQMWMMDKANKAETQLWLRANIFPLIREVRNPDGSKKTKLRPIALLETHLKMIESVADGQHADHMIALMQAQQVGFKVRDGAEAMISAVREHLKNDTNKVLMQQTKSSENHIPCLTLVGASQFVKDGTVAVIQERDGNGKKSALHNSVAKGVWQGSTLSSMQELLERSNSV